MATIVHIWPATYDAPASVMLERHGMPERPEVFDGGGHVWAASRDAKARAEELAGANLPATICWEMTS